MGCVVRLSSGRFSELTSGPLAVAVSRPSVLRGLTSSECVFVLSVLFPTVAESNFDWASASASQYLDATRRPSGSPVK